VNIKKWNLLGCNILVVKKSTVCVVADASAKLETLARPTVRCHHIKPHRVLYPALRQLHRKRSQVHALALLQRVYSLLGTTLLRSMPVQVVSMVCGAHPSRQWIWSYSSIRGAPRHTETHDSRLRACTLQTELSYGSDDVAN
jgi:hypothetical protein